MKVILSPNPYRDHGLKEARNAQAILARCGVETVVCLPFDLDENSRISLPEDMDLRPLEKELDGTDILICFGGDGTILHAARDASPRGIPILGVNLGSVGFMAELEQGELPLLSRLADRKYQIERRMMLDISVKREGRKVFSETALNDAVVVKGAVARMLDLEVTGDRVTISTFSGDGVVIATPTGSTAYCMAAGGPIVEPTSENTIMAPICAHSLHAKPFVLDSRRVVGVRIAPGCRRSAYLSVDGGKAFKLQPGDWVECRKSAQQTQLIRLTGRSFYEQINKKLGKS